MNAHFELLSGILINEGRSVNCVFMYLGWQWYWTNGLTAITLNCLNYLRGRLIYDLVVVSLQPDPYSLICFCFLYHAIIVSEHSELEQLLTPSTY